MFSSSNNKYIKFEVLDNDFFIDYVSEYDINKNSLFVKDMINIKSIINNKETSETNKKIIKADNDSFDINLCFEFNSAKYFKIKTLKSIEDQDYDYIDDFHQQIYRYYSNLITKLDYTLIGELENMENLKYLHLPNLIRITDEIDLKLTELYVPKLTLDKKIWKYLPNGINILVVKNISDDIKPKLKLLKYKIKKNINETYTIRSENYVEVASNNYKNLRNYNYSLPNNSIGPITQNYDAPSDNLLNEYIDEYKNLYDYKKKYNIHIQDEDED